MRFENRATINDGGSYERPKPGKYLGVLIGFADVGTQPSTNYDAKRKVMLRWELHKRSGPSRDNDGNVHTITNMYGATITGKNSLLRKCLEAHGISIPEGKSTDSREWLGNCAWLDLAESPDGKWINIASVSRLDPDEDVAPHTEIDLENWERDSDVPPPPWCHWAIARSTDLGHLVTAKTLRWDSKTPMATSEDDIPF